MSKPPSRVLRSHNSGSNSLPLSNATTTNTRTPRRSVSPRNDSSTQRNTITTSTTTTSTRAFPKDNQPIDPNSIHDDFDSSFHVVENRTFPNNDTSIDPPPPINRTNTNPISREDILRTLRALQARVLQYEERHNQTQQTIRALISRNLALEDELLLAVERKRELRQD